MMPLHLDRIVANTFIQQVRFHESIESTNTDALQFCKSQPCDTPLLVIAEEQTAGRGRGSNQWWSSGGALTFSVVLDPTDFSISEQQWPKASLTTGVAICAALELFAAEHQVALKWPNDVFLNGRKVCGVLVEVAQQRPNAKLVIGIGINVNNSFADAPEELRQIATSLIDTTSLENDLTDVLTAVLLQLEQQFTRLGQDESLADEWQRRCYLDGRSVELETGQRMVAGTCQGIDDEGALVLATDGGVERFFGGVVVGIGGNG